MKVSPEYLRNKADYAEELGYRDHANLLRDAAETIDALGAPRNRNPAIYVPRKSLDELLDKEGSHVAVPTLIHRKPLKSGNGVSRKGWPQIGTVWTYRNGNEYEVVQHANTEGTTPDYPATVIYRNTKNGKTYARRLNLWQPASFTFKRYPVQITNDMLDPFNEIPKRVYWDSEAGCFYRVSAHKGNVYPLPPEFTEAWRGRAKEFPVARKLQPYQKAVLKQFETTPQPELHVEKAFTTPRMRLTFPSLFAPRNGDRAEAKFSLDLSMPYGLKLDNARLTFSSLQAKRDVRPEDSKFTMSLSFPGTVSREQVERMRKQIDDTVLRRRADMADTSIPKGVFFNKANGRFMNLNGETMPMDFYQRWIGRNHLFPATYEAAWDAIAGPATEKKPKVNAELSEPYIPAAEQMRNYIDAGRWIDGKPLDTMKPGICRFLEEIGTTNALGDLIGVMQTNAYSLTAQYKRAGKAGVICVEVELPKAITVDVAR